MTGKLLELFLCSRKVRVIDIDNYCLISILLVFSKILKRAVHRQLINHYLQQHNILGPYQCGFCKCHSTEFAAGA